jgi:hypothetical protein
VMGVFIAWPAPACNNPVFAEIVPPPMRNMVYGALGSTPALVLTSQLCRSCCCPTQTMASVEPCALVSSPAAVSMQPGVEIKPSLWLDVRGLSAVCQNSYCRGSYVSPPHPWADPEH